MLKLAQRTAYRSLKILLMVSAVACTWLASIHLAATGIAALPEMSTPLDLATTLLGAAAIAIFIFSLMVAVLAVYVWYIVNGKLQAAIKEETAEQLAKIGNEVGGRTHAILGYIIGELSVEDDYSKAIDAERLREAIYYCEKAYDLLKDSGIPTEFMALNNLLQYYCISGYTARRGYLLEGARRLRAAGEEHNVPNLLLTYAKTILTFGLDHGEIEQAHRTVKDILDTDSSLNEKPILNEKQRREARQLASLFQKRTLGPEINQG